jgi:hypothetical protein
MQAVVSLLGTQRFYQFRVAVVQLHRRQVRQEAIDNKYVCMHTVHTTEYDRQRILRDLSTKMRARVTCTLTQLLHCSDAGNSFCSWDVAKLVLPSWFYQFRMAVVQLRITRAVQEGIELQQDVFMHACECN